mmetsp:Transcript_110213/g.351271  ORF Transcript_110213/g.351271 Transcript_110213/m.351271 type:complete len:248 (+) Transcript_110213:664-1407(+)
MAVASRPRISEEAKPPAETDLREADICVEASQEERSSKPPGDLPGPSASLRAELASRDSRNLAAVLESGLQLRLGGSARCSLFAKHWAAMDNTSWCRGLTGRGGNDDRSTTSPRAKTSAEGAEGAETSEHVEAVPTSANLEPTLLWRSGPKELKTRKLCLTFSSSVESRGSRFDASKRCSRGPSATSAAEETSARKSEAMLRTRAFSSTLSFASASPTRRDSRAGTSSSMGPPPDSTEAGGGEPSRA